MKIIEGSLLESDSPVIIHQCNCFRAFGSGIALKLKNKYPECYQVDEKTRYGDKAKLGTFTFAQTSDNRIVFNLYSQYKFGRENIVYTDYKALQEGLYWILFLCQQKQITRVGLPYLIGCGLANGDKKIVMNIIQKIQKEYPQIEIQIYRLGDSK